MVLEKTLESLWTAGRSNESILKEFNPEYSLEGLMLKLQYFGHLMQRANSLEKKNPMLGFLYIYQAVLVVKNPPANAGDAGLIPGSGRSPVGGHGKPRQRSCLESPRQATVHGSQRIR